MGQKTNPIGLCVGVIRDREVKWYAEKDFAPLLHEDSRICKFIDNESRKVSVSHVDIECVANRINIAIRTGKPGMAIGKGGSEIKELRNKLSNLTDKKVHINAVEIRKVDTDARLVTENIARQLENRASFRRVQKQAITRAMKLGAKGAKTQVSGRLGGASIARAEQCSEGTVPLHTPRANIDYARAEADTVYDKLGVKVWIYRSEVLLTKNISEGGK